MGGWCARTVAVGISVAAFLLVGPSHARDLDPPTSRDTLAPRELLDQTSWRKATGLLPPEILRHYQQGEYANRILSWDGVMRWGREWQDAVGSNRRRLTVDEAGTIIDKTTGRQPPQVFGYPFPEIDPTDADAGIKILWNHLYDWYRNGNRHNQIELTWLAGARVSRKASQEVYFLYYDGQPQARGPRTNPDNLLVQFIATTPNPIELRGTTTLSWRYRDADKPDALWTYLPALRRVRSIAPTNRSDGFLGSDMSQDDGAFFDGKPESFLWKVVGEREQLVLADPFGQPGDCVSTPLPEGGWQTDFKDVPMAGFQDPTWNGVGWAPVSQVLLRRPVWVIEGVPRDRYYGYGKIQLHIDKETFQGSWNRKFDWKGELLSTFQVTGTGPNRSLDGGKSHLAVGCTFVRIAENLKLNRATVAAVDPRATPINRHAVPLDPRFFDHATLARFAK